MVWEKIYSLIKNQTRFQYEMQLQKERDAHEREQVIHKLELALRDRTEDALRLEAKQLREQLERTERLTLPPSPPKPPDEPSKD